MRLHTVISPLLPALFATLLAACSSDPAASGDDDAGGDVDGGVQADATVVTVLLADGVTIRDVALFQSVKLPLVSAGALATPQVPPIAGRAGAVRIYVDALLAPRRVTAELSIGARVFSASATLSATSRDEDPTSLITIPLPADALAEGAHWSVRLLADDGVPLPALGTPADARFPRDGSATDLGVSTPTKLEIVLVPMRYDTDGSGRLPDLSDAQLARYESILTALYPLSDVIFTVHAPVAWNMALSTAGNVRFGSINDVLISLRAQEAAPARVYYYGVIAPAENFGTYCGSGCVSGQSYVIDSASSGTRRVGSGLGFAGERSGWTMAHELGHVHGRSHAPCGVSSWDADYPHSRGAIGVWGYDSRSMKFVAPTATDFMGYCDEEWISDYTYTALYTRIRALESLQP